ncbi:MAG TPA: hypothetical protein VMR41_05135 [Patescibacteria group bacterium]|jgi:hypothetical protein|nr:hypothetical protein [Patescibacteria group bacterium]
MIFVVLGIASKFFITKTPTAAVVKNPDEQLATAAWVSTQVQATMMSYGYKMVTPTAEYAIGQQNIQEPVVKIESTPTPIGSDTSNVLGLKIQKWLYSYYYPPLGGANCADFEGGVCLSLLSSGDRWQDWLGRSVACSSEIPLGTKIVIIAPVEVRGVYVCNDRGGLIEGTRYLDFLDTLQKLPWREAIYGYEEN